MNINLVNYLRLNHSALNLNMNNLDDLSLMDSDLENNLVFIIGENHGVKANVEFRMKFLKYFKEQTNFKYYLYELPYSVAYFINVYLGSGKEEILKDIYQALRGTYGWNQDEYDHFKDLYEYNKTLLKEDRIIILGIDIEHQPENAFKYILDSLNKNNVSGILNEYLSSYFERKDSISDEEIMTLYKAIKEELYKNENYYRKLLKEDFSRVVHVNENIKNKLYVYHSNNFNGTRDIKVYENFLSISIELPINKYFGQFGLSHVFQRAFPYLNWFAAQLANEESRFKGKVISIVYAYDNCRYLYPTDRRNYESSVNTWDHSIEAFKDFTGNKYTLFKLNGEDSPFSKDLIWPLTHKFPIIGVTADYFQYLVLIKESEAMIGFEIVQSGE